MQLASKCLDAIFSAFDAQSGPGITEGMLFHTGAPMFEWVTWRLPMVYNIAKGGALSMDSMAASTHARERTSFTLSRAGLNLWGNFVGHTLLKLHVWGIC